jgi:hypothetical protein
LPEQQDRLADALQRELDALTEKIADTGRNRGLLAKIVRTCAAHGRPSSPGEPGCAAVQP